MLHLHHVVVAKAVQLLGRYARFDVRRDEVELGTHAALSGDRQYFVAQIAFDPAIFCIRFGGPLQRLSLGVIGSSKVRSGNQDRAVRPADRLHNVCIDGIAEHDPAVEMAVRTDDDAPCGRVASHTLARPSPPAVARDFPSAELAESLMRPLQITKTPRGSWSSTNRMAPLG